MTIDLPARLNPEVSDEVAHGLVALGTWLRVNGYSFVTVTPETHRIVNSKVGTSTGFDLREIFGWSRRFRTANIPVGVRALLDRANVISEDGPRAVSRVRYSTLGSAILLHSAYPTSGEDCVFFGPDTYRFVQFILRHAPSANRPLRVADVGCGSGAGGLALAAALPHSTVVLADINPKALAYARINARMASIEAVEFAVSDVLDGVTGQFDLIIANPPYMRDSLKRTYRDGGRHFGTALSVRIVKEALKRLTPGGRLLLYTGAPVVDGIDIFLSAVTPLLRAMSCTFSYAEIDPDVFGEELQGAEYVSVERIAAVGLVVDLV